VAVEEIMKVAIELPDDIVEALSQKQSDLCQYTAEILAIEAYRSGALTPEQLHRMLSLNTRQAFEGRSQQGS
jgi:hypothetical protein